MRDITIRSMLPSWDVCWQRASLATSGALFLEESVGIRSRLWLLEETVVRILAGVVAAVTVKSMMLCWTPISIDYLSMLNRNIKCRNT